MNDLRSDVSSPIEATRDLISKYDIYGLNPDEIQRYNKAYEKHYKRSLENLLKQVIQFK